MTSTTNKYVYYFGDGKAEGDKSMKHLLGGKGANLAEMVNLKIPVPAGFTITTKVCAIYEESKGNLPEAVKEQIFSSLQKVEKNMGKKFGDPSNPLLFSVRSGAAASMPGMMDTVLNLGLNMETVNEWVRRKPSMEKFVLDSYRRFITMYADVVMQVGREDFEHELQEIKKKHNFHFDSEMTVENLRELCKVFLDTYEKLTKRSFPQDPMEQLFSSINAVFRSWGNPRAVKYRQMYHITGLLGTAVNIQAMVFGNFNERSATGVAFTRNPSTGENYFYGEYLINAQGEDVVAGIRTPQQIGKELSVNWAKDRNISEEDRLKQFPSMEESMPENYKMLCDIRKLLENHYLDMQDIEFTVEDGRLWMLQTRNAKRTIRAAVKCAVDMVNEGMITEEQGVLRIDPDQVSHLLHPSFSPKAKLDVIAKGLAASPGAAVGQIVFNAEDAQKWKESGKVVIMVRTETSPEDLGGMAAAEGILTVRGGMTSHAAVVARGMGKTCVSGCGDIRIDNNAKTMTVKDQVFNEGDWISIDGTKGLVIRGKVPLEKQSLKDGDLGIILNWCHKIKRLGVRANADTPNDTMTAMSFGAEGVGLCRTEHMFFEGHRIDAMREMILASDSAGRGVALDKILPLQRGDFTAIFKAMNGKPCTIRLLDPPLHEFVPHDAAAQEDLARKMNVSPAEVAARVKSLHEENPMLGHRGVRLGISYPEIYNMQVQAIMEAAIEVFKNHKLSVVPEIMIPLVGKKEELVFAKEQAVKTAEKVLEKEGVNIPYLIGTMIEVPRAAVTADEIAEAADFFSFGTNDLTQMGCGFSRDDAAGFLKRYAEHNIYSYDPFESLDQEGVGELMRIAVRKGRSVCPNLKMGICGEHGGDPRTIEFCHQLGLNYVSCSPFRVPVAIVAAAHAALKENEAREMSHKAIASKY
eukprot:Tbor_TRINITY_DN5436_c0_g1::TRINITY_DN5436_c0_g1_i1::g.24899::m.24899/K01006/ppdK; pyruvate, orthophosphate dikinase